jgi:hypothetical protein
MITIVGNGSTIRRASTALKFRILAINPLGNLQLQQATLTGGFSLGTGGSVYNADGTVKLTQSTCNKVHRPSAYTVVNREHVDNPPYRPQTRYLYGDHDSWRWMPGVKACA